MDVHVQAAYEAAQASTTYLIIETPRMSIVY